MKEIWEGERENVKKKKDLSLSFSLPSLPTAPLVSHLRMMAPER